MPHYVLDARTATPHFPGIGRYVTNLARALGSRLAASERLTVLHDPAHPIPLPAEPHVQAMPVAASPFSLQQQWVIPRLLRRLRADVYHSAYVLMPYLPGTRTVLTVYDLIPLRYPEHSTARARLFGRWVTQMALRTAHRVIAISEFTRRDFMAEFGLPSDHIVAISLAADPTFRPQPTEAIAAIRARYHLPETFILYVGSNKPHKNMVHLLKAWSVARSGFQLPASNLVIAGAWDARYPEARQLAEASSANPPSIIWLGPAPETDLPALYSAATTFVFPSLYEGFGLPVLEAMACGTPVICSNTSSLPEVTGDAALQVDPMDATALAAALEHVLSNADLRSELCARGLARAAGFNWAQTAAVTLALYREKVS